jgi:hypothetical protein
MNVLLFLLAIGSTEDFQLVCLDINPAQDTLLQVIEVREALELEDIPVYFEFFPNFFVVAKTDRINILQNSQLNIHIEEESQGHNWETSYPETGKYMKPIWLNVFSMNGLKAAKSGLNEAGYIRYLYALPVYERYTRAV